MHSRAFRSTITFFLIAGITAGQGVISTLVGTDWVFPSSSIPAINAPLGRIVGVAVDQAGNVYGGDCDNHFIFKVDIAGTLSVVAGNGIAGFSGDGTAAGTRLNCPTSLVFDGAGDILFLDAGRIQKLTADRRIVTIAGGGSNSAEGAPALQAQIGFSDGLAVDGAGSIYYSNRFSHRIRKVGTDGLVRTFAGTGVGGFNGDGGQAVLAQLNQPTGLAAAADGTIYIADSANYRVRAVSPNGTIRTIAGTGQSGSSGDGGQATAATIYSADAIFVESSGSVLISHYGVIRRVAPSGIISTIAGGKSGFSGDGGPATAAAIGGDLRVGRDVLGNLFIADPRNSRIRKVDLAGRINTFAGSGNWRRNGDKASPIAAWLISPQSVAVSPEGYVTFTDQFDFGTMRQIATNGQLIRLANLGHPGKITFDSAGNIFGIGGCGIYKISPDGKAVELVVGDATAIRSGRGCGFGGDNGPATGALLGSPHGIALSGGGELYIADSGNHRIRKVDRDGTIRTIAGNGSPGFGGDGGPASDSILNRPSNLLLDPSGNLFFIDAFNYRVRRIAPDGTIATIAGGGRNTEGNGDGGPAIQASLNVPAGLALDAAGNLFIADTYDNRIRVVRPTGLIAPFAGSGSFGFNGDGGSPLNAAFRNPSGVAVDANGNVYIADTGNDRIRLVQSASTTFELSATALSLSLGGFGTANPVEVLLNSSIRGLSYQATATTPNNGGWLSVGPASGTLPATLHVSVNAAGLAPGQHTGTITVNVPLATPPTRQVSVTLAVPPIQSPKLSVGSESISFKVQQGAQSSPIGLSVSNQGGGALNYTTTIRTASGGNWITVSPDKGQLAAGSNATLSLTANPGTLTEGTYSAAVSISDGSTAVTVPVTLSITRPQGKLLLSQVGLGFTAVEGGGAPAPQTFAVLNEGSGELPFEAKTVLRSGDAPIKLNNPTGRLIRPLQDVSFVEVVPDTRNLTQGEYDADIRVTSPGLPPQTVIVKVTVLPRGSKPGPEVRPTGLVFIGTPGTIPRSEDVIVSNIAATPTTYVSSSLTWDTAKWISHLPSAATINPNEPRRIVVQPDFTGVTPGIKRASLNLLFIEDGSTRTVSILSIVPATAPVPNKNGTREVAGCNSPNLRSEFLSLPEGGAISVGQPVTIEVKVADDCGNLLLGNEKSTNSAVYTKFSNGDLDVRLVPIGNGVWSGTWRPLNPAASGVTVSAISKFVQGPIVQEGQRDRTVRLTAGANVPIIRQLSLVNSASQKGYAPVAPGTLVTIYGSNLASSSKNSSIPLPLEVDGTQVLLSGQPLPILNISPNQINMQIPFDIPVNTSHQIVVRRGNALSVPESFNVASAQPGIFTRNSTGTGQGVVIGPDQITIADSAKPALRGQAIVIYCTGVGAVTPSVVLGAAAPSSPLAATVSSVEVLVGEKKAQVLFSGLTPGFSGLYQVNAVLAADTPTGDAVPVTISTSGQISNIVTIAVR